jgi:Uma2 family endonuclease
VINTNLIAAVSRLLAGKPCRPLDSNMRVRISGKSSYVYPDISVVCGGPIFDADDPKQTTITNPRVVIEVLSESTESYDRGGKFNLYGSVVSLEEYLLVSQRRPLIETYLRQADGTWTFTSYEGMESSVLLRSLQISIPLAEVYADVSFDGAPGPALKE